VASVNTTNLICEVTNKKGLHARAAAKIVALSNEYESEITLSHKNKSASSQSLIKLLTLDAPKGSKIKIEIQGIDANKASTALTELFAAGFQELD